MQDTQDFWRKVKVTPLVVIPFLAIFAAMVLLWKQYVFPLDLVLMVVLYTISVLGVTIGYHRMLTHNGFQAPAWLRMVILLCGCTSFEADPATWAAMHIKHHAHSDDDDDPHSPLHGFWHAHVGWLFIDKNYRDAEDFAPQLMKDPVVAYLRKIFYFWALLGLLIPGLIGGWTGFLWGGLVRLFLVSHVTYSVNSICHTFGKRHFETTDESRNEWIVGLLAFGEGWHNNHHAFPRSAFHGLRWWQLDMSGMLIYFFEKIGLVWNVERVPEMTIESHKISALRRFDAVKNIRTQLLDMLHHAQEEISRLRREYGKAPITPQEIDETVSACEAALNRLEEIRKSVMIAHHLRKQKLDAYVREVQQMVGALKARVSPTRA